MTQSYRDSATREQIVSAKKDRMDLIVTYMQSE